MNLVDVGLPDDDAPGGGEPLQQSLRPDQTLRLLRRLQSGEEGATDELLARYLPLIKRAMHGRLPQFARSMHETMDVVQDSMLRAIPRLTTLEARHEGALLHFFYTCAKNRIRDLIRDHKRKPRAGEDIDPDALPDDATSPLEQLLDAERMERFESARAELSADDQQLIMLRFDFGYKFRDVAVAMDLPTAEAARQAVNRAVERLRRHGTE